MSASSLTPSPQLPPTDDLAKVMRKNLVRLALSLVAIGVITAIFTSRFDRELELVTDYVFDELGIFGVTAALFITDSFISPLPPDSLLILIANSDYHQNWPPLITGLGLVSCLAGYVGFGCGRLFSKTRFFDSMLRATRERSQERIAKYGSWAVVLGALTPIPFSITCWTAGLMHLPFRMVWWPCLLRVPRYVLYYAAIVYVPRRLVG